ncbi:MAG: SIS domain-containing protein [Erysipelotrichaceae bacterium]|nr:SIS domain-containing protein [Erysipelotrichaceae bacterium]
MLVFFGIGSSGILAEYAARSISSSGKICYFIKDPFYPIFTQEISNTLLIVFSVSGNTEEALQFVLNFKSPNNLLISITNGKDNKLAKLSDYNLSYNMPSVVNEGYYLNLTSQIPVLYIIEAMMKEVAELIKK